MKKVFICLAIISSIVLLITFCVVGVKLLDGNYDTIVEVYITGVSLIICLGSIVGYKLMGIRCPHCGKINDSLFGKGKFCPHCGKEL